MTFCKFISIISLILPNITNYKTHLSHFPNLEAILKRVNIITNIIDVKCYKSGKSGHFGLLTPDLGLFYIILPLCKHVACWDKNLCPYFRNTTLTIYAKKLIKWIHWKESLISLYIILLLPCIVYRYKDVMKGF